MRTGPTTLLALAAAFLPCAAAATTPPLAHHTCPDGLEVVVAESHATPLVTIEIAVHNGSMTEAPDYNGLSHLYEHMFFKGNAALPDQLAYLARARALGMSWNGTTNTERVNYFFTTTSDHLADSMTFMRDAIVTPRFDPKELERERVVVTGEIDRNESDPFYHLWHTVEQHVFWKYPSYKDPLGARATVLAATVDKMRTIQQRYYVPNNSLLIITGDVHADDVFRQADQLYTGWARTEDPFVKHPLVKHPPIRRAEIVLVPQPVENFNAQVTWQGPSTIGDGVADTYAADMLGQLLNDAGSRFQTTLVDSGLCVKASLGYETQRNTGEIGITFEAVPAKVDACVKAVFAELPKLHAPEYFTDEEMHNAAHRIEVAAAENRETTGGYAHAVSFFWATASLDYYASYEDQVKAVKQADIVRVADRWLLGKPFVFGAMASPALIKGGVTQTRLAKDAGIGGAR